MYKICFVLLLFLRSPAFCQSDEIKNEASGVQKSDSIINSQQKKKDSLAVELKLSDTAVIKPERTIDTDYFVRLQKENRDRQKKSAIRNIAIGVALFVVLIIGLRRRGKK